MFLTPSTGSYACFGDVSEKKIMTTAVSPSPADLTNMTVPESGSRSTVSYFPRHLRFSDHKGEVRYIRESELLAIPGPKIILAEQGMGKSELMREAARKLKI
jgi:hypothetical protein